MQSRARQNALIVSLLWGTFAVAAIESAVSRAGDGSSAPPTKSGSAPQPQSRLASEASSAVRTWSDVTGRFSVEAKFVRLEKEQVVLHTTAGREIKVPLAKLGESDRQIARELAASPRPAEPSAALALERPLHIAISTHPLAVTFAAQNGPYVAVEGGVYHLLTSERCGKTRPVRLAEGADDALSVNGRYHAVMVPTLRPLFQVIDTSSGQFTQSIPRPLNFVGSWLEFVGNDRIAMLGRVGAEGRLALFGLQQTEPLHMITLAEPPLAAAISADAESIAIISASQLSIHSTSSGRATKSLELQLSLPRGLSFSPDGERLAIYHGQPVKLLELTRDGEKLDEIPLSAIPATGGAKRTVQWFPDGSGWLVGGAFYVDRKSRCLIWELSGGDTSHTARLLNDNSVALVTSMAGPKVLRDVTIPRKDLTRAVAAAMANGEKFHNGSEPVQLGIAVANDFGGVRRVRDHLGLAMVELLKRSRMTAGLKGNRTLRLRSTETLKPAQIVWHMDLINGDGESIWKYTTVCTPPKFVLGASPQQKLRSYGVQHLLKQIPALRIPFYVSGDDSIPALPIVTDLRRSQGALENEPRDGEPPESNSPSRNAPFNRAQFETTPTRR